MPGLKSHFNSRQEIEYKSLESDFNSQSEDVVLKEFQLLSDDIFHRKAKRTIYLIALYLTSLLLISLLILLFYSQRWHSGDICEPRPITCNCGNTIKEAHSLSCKYDSLSASWLPPQCRDDQLTAEFKKSSSSPSGRWIYYADRNATTVLTQHEISMMAELPLEQAYFWTTFEWHLSHCSFYWRKEFRSRQRGLTIEDRYDRESHIKHCHMAFLNNDGTPLKETSTRAVIMLGGDRNGAVRDKLHSDEEHKGHNM
ncbi:hypothetical protein F5884DRAFT_884328 [Xylogone sp. PMI_703]|nr:hypothetical protein F5884DRAFT_884328 [Xylogone sp. PMI_703]